MATATADHRLSPRQYIARCPLTSALLGFNLIVFLAMVAGAAAARHVSWAAVGDRLLHTSSATLIRWGADYGPLTLAGQWWRLLPAIFVHIGILHLVSNLLYLFFAGQIAERIYRRRTYAFLFFFSGLAGSVVSLWWNPLVLSAGASGALFGMAGSMLVMLRWARLPLPRREVQWASLCLLIMVGVTLFYGLTARIDNAAHVGGLLGGVVAGSALMLWKRRDTEGGLHMAPAVAAMLAVVLAAAGALAWWSRRYVVPMERGRALMQQNQIVPAIAELRHATRLGPRSAEAHRLLGEASIRRADYGTAQANLVLATELGPRNADNWSMLGLLYLGTRRPREAIEPLSRAAELQPKSTAIRYNLGVAYIGARQYEQAIATLKQVAAEAPNDPEVYRALAFAYQSRGMTKEADAARQRAGEL